MFTNTLAVGAFGAPAPAFYTIANTDGLAPSPSVSAALIVAGSPNVVELALDQPLVKGAVYTVSAVGVPATDLSTTPAGSTAGMQWGLTAAKTNVEPIARDREKLLYLVDLFWDGSDFAETPTGDLGQISGTPNVTKALYRGVESNGVPWDSTYGARAKEYVDSPSSAAGTLKGSVTAQLLRDPRVGSVKITHEISDDKTYLYADPKLVSGDAVDRVTVEVPNA